MVNKETQLEALCSAQKDQFGWNEIIQGLVAKDRMSRAVKKDFAELLTFVETYSIARHSKDPAYLKLASRCHKRYFALMVVGAEIER